MGSSGVATYGLALSDVGGSTLGIVLSVTNAFFWGLYTVYYRKLKNQDPIRTVATQFLIGGLIFVPFLPFGFYLNPTPGFFVDLGYVTVIGGAITLLLWNAMARMESIGRVTTLAFAVPATSVVIQALLTGETPTSGRDPRRGDHVRWNLHLPAPPGQSPGGAPGVRTCGPRRLNLKTF